MENEKIYTKCCLFRTRSIIHTCCGKQSIWIRRDLLPYPTIPDCIEAVVEGRVAYALVPLENALEGSVPMTIDYLFHGKDLFINAEISIPIEQHLMVNKAQVPFINELESIHSHPHALAQCHKYLQYHYRRVPLIQTTSTAAAAKYISENPEKRLLQSETSYLPKNTDYISQKKIFMIFILIIHGLSFYHCEKVYWKWKAIPKKSKQH